MEVKELITNQTEIKVHSFDQHVPESKEVDLFLFDDHLLQFIHSFDKESTVLRRRPDWGGTIFKIMKNNKHVSLFERVWYQVSYKSDLHNFWFERCNLVARYSCILFYPVLPANREKQTLQSLLQLTIEIWREASRSTVGRTYTKSFVRK